MGSVPGSSGSQAMLLAVLTALQSVGPNVPLNLNVASEYGVKAVTAWPGRWRRRDWKNNQDKPVKNRQLIPPVEALLAARIAPTNFAWVKQADKARDNALKACDSNKEGKFDGDVDSPKNAFQL